MRRRPPLLALAYHGVADVPLRRDPHRFFSRPDDVRRDIRLLRRWGYELVTFGDLARRAAAGERAGLAALTFDDGFADNLHRLAPLLRAERAPATVFAVPGWLGEPHPSAPVGRILTADELCDLHRRGVEIGGHTTNHVSLAGLGYESARQELEEGRGRLEELLQAPVTVAAYPWGHADDDARRACRDAGFDAACGVNGEGRWDDPFDLPRQDMQNRSTALGLRLKRDDRYMPLVRHRPVRAVRRLSLAARGGSLRRPQPGAGR